MCRQLLNKTCHISALYRVRGRSKLTFIALWELVAPTEEIIILPRSETHNTFVYTKGQFTDLTGIFCN